jgi:hypothetical protein
VNQHPDAEAMQILKSEVLTSAHLKADLSPAENLQPKMTPATY